MEGKVQRPKSSHKKSISIVLSRAVGSEDGGNRGAPGRRRRVKYGTGKSAGVELVPQPSDSPLDPLNWPQWKKNVTFGSLMLTSAIVGILKTMLVTVNGVIATEFNVSYMAATALTGLPMIVAAVAGLGSSVLGRVIGKRAIYLASGVLMLVAMLWNMHVMESYAQFMASRIFQAVGWGATESLVLDSVRDIYFSHERGPKVNILNVVRLVFTWGSPILGGYVSQSNGEFRNQIMIINIIQAFSVLLLIVATPETNFNRSELLSEPVNQPVTFTSTTISAGSTPSASKFKFYLSTMRFTNAHSTSKFTVIAVLSPLRALSAPSTLLTFLLTAPLLASAYGVANIISLLFSSMPTFLFPASLGYIFILPLILGLVFYSIAAVSTYLRSRPPNHLSTSRHLSGAIGGLMIGVAGLISFGIYTVSQLSPQTFEDGATVFSLDVTGENLSLRIVSLLFGLIVGGAIVLSYSGSQHLLSSTSSPEGEMESGHRTLQEILAGVFVIGFPIWIQGDGSMLAGLKMTLVAVSVVQIVLASTVATLFWTKNKEISHLDARVLGKRKQRAPGSVALKRWNTNESFFDA